MCYSALVRQDLKALASDYHAQVLAELWDAINERQRVDPKKVKLPTPEGRIYPFYYAPIIHLKDRARVIAPMRYSAFPPAYLSAAQAKGLTSYNARRDSLRKRFWSEAYGKHHGVLIVRGFYEWVKVHSLLKDQKKSLAEVEEHLRKLADLRKEALEKEGKPYKPTATEKKPTLERDVILNFVPRSGHDLIVPTIFSRDPQSGDWGFALVTNDPNPEIAAAGHDRMPLQLLPDQVDSWLRTAEKSLDEFDQILLQGAREFFEYQLAAS